jgi:2-octaprenylphenol hydroxylase
MTTEKEMSSDQHHNPHYDIVVVGAGLVGATFVALLLQQQKNSEQPLRIALIDGGPAPTLPNLTESTQTTFDPRVVALTQASQTVFENLGLWVTITDQRACRYTKMHVWDNDGTASIKFDAKEMHLPQLGHIVENSLLQCAVLDYIATQESVTVLRGLTVEALDSEKNSADKKQRIVSCSDGTILSASLLVAADGGQSKLRALAGMSVRKWEYEHKAIVATVQSTKSHQFTAWQNFLSTGPLAFLPLDHPSEEYCSIVWSVDTEAADALMALDDTAFSDALARAFEHRLGPIKSVSRRFCFPLLQRHAVDYVGDSLVLIGDAAHTIHPLAGQGVNLGLLDAQALANELTRAVERDLIINHASVLRRYQRRRKAHNLEVMLLMEGFKRLFGSRHILFRWMRNVGMKKINQWSFLKNLLAKQAINNHEK